MKNFCNKHKKVIVIVVLLLLCVLIVVGYRINSSLDKKNESNENNDSGQIIDYKNIIYSYGNELEKISIDYYNENKELLSFDELLNKVKFTNDVSCELNVVNNDGTIYLENCTVDGEFVEGYTYGEKKENDKTINKDDGTIIIYEKNGQATMNAPENMTDYKIYSIDVNGSMYEILKGLGSYLFYVDDNYNGQMINYKTNEKILNNVIYDAVYPIYKSDSEFYDSSNIIIRKDNKWSIYDLGTGNRRGSVYESFDIIGRETSVGPRTEIETLVGNNIMVKNNGKYGVIDYVTGKVVVPIRYNSIYKEYNYLVVDNDIYDFYDKGRFGISQSCRVIKQPVKIKYSKYLA
mgnify:CR=1 FL=1